jgi:FKBP-type peptidyl-prolyl cis-trans isomerase 2
MAAAAPPQPPPIKASHNDFRAGEKVSFDDKYLQPQVGTVVRINQRTATVDTGNFALPRLA